MTSTFWVQNLLLICGIVHELIVKIYIYIKSQIYPLKIYIYISHTHQFDL